MYRDVIDFDFKREKEDDQFHFAQKFRKKKGCIEEEVDLVRFLQRSVATFSLKLD